MQKGISSLQNQWQGGLGHARGAAADMQVCMLLLLLLVLPLLLLPFSCMAAVHDLLSITYLEEQQELCRCHLCKAPVSQLVSCSQGPTLAGSLLYP